MGRRRGAKRTHQRAARLLQAHHDIPYTQALGTIRATLELPNIDGLLAAVDGKREVQLFEVALDEWDFV